MGQILYPDDYRAGAIMMVWAYRRRLQQHRSSNANVFVN